jgi:hypothetical protein
MYVKRSTTVALLGLCAIGAAGHAQAARCRNQAGEYRLLEACTIDGREVPRDHDVTITQDQCASATLSTRIEIPVPMPGGGPYDMCAIAEFNCGLYGDCDVELIERCRDRPPAPPPEVVDLSYSVSYDSLTRDFSGRILTIGQCRVYR